MDYNDAILDVCGNYLWKKTMTQSMKNEEKKSGSILLNILASLLVALLPFVYFLSRNISQLSLNDILLTLGVVVLHWLVLFILCLLILRDFSKASLLTSIIILPVSGFRVGINFVNRYFPAFYYWHGLILLLLSFGILCYLTNRFIKKEYAFKINQIIGAVFLFLILFNGVPVAYKQIKEWKPQNKPTNIVSVEQNKKTDAQARPNIYFFIFDEYSGPEGLERFYNFDNHQFYRRLTDLGFNVSMTSHSHAIVTVEEIPNLLNLFSDATNNTKMDKDSMLKDPILFTTLQNLGYDLNLINDQGFISTPDTYFKYKFESQDVFQVDESLLTLLIDKSLYYPLRHVAKGKRLIELRKAFDYAVESSTFQESNLFTVAYFMFPHNPFVVDEHGNDLNVSEARNWKDNDIYIGQLKYASKVILDMVEKIQKNDPHSVIILMSDHGSRRLFRLYLNAEVEIENYDLEAYYARNILNAVYFSGETIDIEGHSGVNTLRMVLDRLFSLGLGLIEETK